MQNSGDNLALSTQSDVHRPELSNPIPTHTAGELSSQMCTKKQASHTRSGRDTKQTWG